MRSPEKSAGASTKKSRTFLARKRGLNPSRGFEPLESRELLAGATPSPTFYFPAEASPTAIDAAVSKIAAYESRVKTEAFNIVPRPNIGPPPLLTPQQKPTLTLTLTQNDVSTILKRAAAATANDSAIVAVVDRGGNLLGLRVEAGVSPQITSDPAKLTFAIDGAISLARTGAFFANNTAPLTSRTIQDISQSTITQREVQSSPDVFDANSVLRGPGFVAPIGLMSHFPPRVDFTPQVDLFQIEHTNRDTTISPGTNGVIGGPGSVVRPSRFNVPTEYLPPNVRLDPINPPDSYGYISGLLPSGQPRGVATLPGGIPIFKHLGSNPNSPASLAGGVGVFFPGTTGYATEENSKLNQYGYDPNKPDLSIEAEFAAFVAAGGSPGFGAPLNKLPIGNAPAEPNIFLPSGRIDLVGITLDIVGPHGLNGPTDLVNAAKSFGFAQGNADSGVNLPVNQATATKPADTLLSGKPVQEGWLVLPHASADGLITVRDIVQMVAQGVFEANRTRAAIRLPFNNTARMTFAVSDRNGNVLGVYRMPDSTVFSIDVAVSKARNIAYYNNAALLQPIDRIPGIPAGTAITNRTIRYLSLPRFPEGIDGYPPGPFSILNDGGVNPVNGSEVGPPLPASAFQTVQGYDAFHPQTNFHDPYNPANQSGIVFFPGSQGIYKTINGVPTLAGGLGVSGDGVDQDDVVTFAASQGFRPPATIESDQYKLRGVRLVYQKFNRQPHVPIGPDNHILPEKPISPPITPMDLKALAKSGKKI